MRNLLKSEFYKLFHSWYFWGIGGFNLLLSSFLLLDSKEATSSLIFASLYNTPLLYFFTIVFAALFIGNDFENRTLQSYINTGHRRGRVMCSKALVYQVGCMIILVIPLFIHGLVGSLFLNETVRTVDGNSITVIKIIISIVAMCMLPFFFAFIFRDMGKTLTVPMVIFFLMIFLMNGKQAQYISQILPMGQLRLISLQHSSSFNMNFTFINLGWIVALYVGSYLWFRRSDLK